MNPRSRQECRLGRGSWCYFFAHGSARCNGAVIRCTPSANQWIPTPRFHTPVPEALEGLVYSRPILKDYTLDENELEHTCLSDLGRRKIYPQHDLRLLDPMPLELLSNILVRLDIRSLIDFRRVNQRALQVIDSIP